MQIHLWNCNQIWLTYLSGWLRLRLPHGTSLSFRPRLACRMPSNPENTLKSMLHFTLPTWLCLRMAPTLVRTLISWWSTWESYLWKAVPKTHVRLRRWASNTTNSRCYCKPYRINIFCSWDSVTFHFVLLLYTFVLVTVLKFCGVLYYS